MPYPCLHNKQRAETILPGWRLGRNWIFTIQCVLSTFTQESKQPPEELYASENNRAPRNDPTLRPVTEHGHKRSSCAPKATDQHVTLSAILLGDHFFFDARFAIQKPFLAIHTADDDPIAALARNGLNQQKQLAPLQLAKNRGVQARSEENMSD